MLFLRILVPSEMETSSKAWTWLIEPTFFHNCCTSSLDSLHSSSYFQVLQSLYQFFGNSTKSTDYNWYKRHFHVPQFFKFPSKVEVFILLFTFFQFYFVVNRDSKDHSFASSPFLLIIISSSRLAEIKGSVCMSKPQKNLYVSFSRTGTRLCIYHWFVWTNFNFLHNFQWMTMPTKSYLVLYSFYANLLHSLIMWLIVSSLSLHNLHLQFCSVLSYLALIWLVLMALFCTAIRRD